jgi:hypothetical protein
MARRSSWWRESWASASHACLQAGTKGVEAQAGLCRRAAAIAEATFTRVVALQEVAHQLLWLAARSDLAWQKWATRVLLSPLSTEEAAMLLAALLHEPSEDNAPLRLHVLHSAGRGSPS